MAWPGKPGLIPTLQPTPLTTITIINIYILQLAQRSLQRKQNRQIKHYYTAIKRSFLHSSLVSGNYLTNSNRLNLQRIKNGEIQRTKALYICM